MDGGNEQVTHAGQVVKLAAIRDPAWPAGQKAPCYFWCPCGGPRMPAFSGIQVCTCGKAYNSFGWLL